MESTIYKNQSLQPKQIHVQGKNVLPQTTFKSLFENNIPLCRSVIVNCEEFKSFEHNEEKISSFIYRLKSEEQPKLLKFKLLVDALSTILGSDERIKECYTLYGVQKCLKDILNSVDDQDIILLFTLCIDKNCSDYQRNYNITIWNILLELDISQLSDNKLINYVIVKLHTQYSTNFPPDTSKTNSSTNMDNKDIKMTSTSRARKLERSFALKKDLPNNKSSNFSQSSKITNVVDNSKSVEAQKIKWTDTSHAQKLKRSLAFKNVSPNNRSSSFSQNSDITTNTTKIK